MAENESVAERSAMMHEGQSDVPHIFCLDCRYPLHSLRESRCPECGRLFDPDDPSTFGVDRGPLVKLYGGATGWDAHLLRGMLEEQGIAAQVLGDVLGMARGDLPMTVETLPAVWVGELDVPKALEIAAMFDQIKRDGPTAREASRKWTCPDCGEALSGQFTECWNCGASRPEGVSQDDDAHL